MSLLLLILSGCRQIIEPSLAASDEITSDEFVSDTDEPIESETDAPIPRPSDSAAYIRLHGPIDVSVIFESEELNSATGKLNAGFGDMTVTGPTHDRTIEIHLDYGHLYGFEIVGTGTGSMDFTVEYNDGTGSNNRQFQGIEITPTTNIICYDFAAFGDMELYVNHSGDGLFDEIWYSSLNCGLVTTPDETLLETYLYFNSLA